MEYFRPENCDHVERSPTETNVYTFVDGADPAQIVQQVPVGHLCFFTNDNEGITPTPVVEGCEPLIRRSSASSEPRSILLFRFKVDTSGGAD